MVLQYRDGSNGQRELPIEKPSFKHSSRVPIALLWPILCAHCWSGLGDILALMSSIKGAGLLSTIISQGRATELTPNEERN